MKTHISVSLFTAAMLVGCSGLHNVSPPKQARAPTLWENTAVGMTVEDVKRAQPAVFPSNRSNAVYDDAADELLQLNGVVLGNQKFDAAFFFASNKLVRVDLVGMNRVPKWETARAIFLALQADLRVQYGKEDESSILEQLPIRMASAEWARGGTKINLLLFDSALINVRYECAAWGEEASRAMRRGHRRIDPKPRTEEHISC